MAKEFTDADDALLAELGVDVETKAPPKQTPREERIIAGFEDIVRFVEENGRAPQHGEDRDIFERLYAVRLDRLMALEECRALVEPIDTRGLLGPDPAVGEAVDDEMDDDALLQALGVQEDAGDVSKLRHVRSSAEKRVAEEIAAREPCKDFAEFKPLFGQIQADLQDGLRQTRPFERDTEIAAGQFFIVGGQKAYVASVEEEFLTPEGRPNRRMRVIYDNGTENRALMRSFQRALYKEENTGRRITEPAAGPLFADRAEAGDEASGTIYVLRSKSNHPTIAGSRELIHKIGVTNMPVAKRIAGADLQPTFLMAEVEIVRTYELFNINRTKLENLLHRVFAAARLNIEIKDRFGNPVTPREWFLVPLAAIEEVVDRIQDGTISRYRYNPETASLEQRDAP